MNWCLAHANIQANEEVVDGMRERGTHPVVRLPMKQISASSPSNVTLRT